MTDTARSHNKPHDKPHAPSTCDQDELTKTIHHIIEHKLRYQGTRASHWHTGALFLIGLGLLGWTGLLAFRFVVRPLDESAIYALIDEAIADNLPRDSTNTAHIEEQLAVLKHQVEYLITQRRETGKPPQTVESIPTESAHIETRNSLSATREPNSQLSTSSDWVILHPEQFQLEPGTSEGNYTVDIPEGHIQPVVANLGAGQSLAINNVPEGISLTVYGLDGRKLTPNPDGTWRISSTGDHTIDFIGHKAAQGTTTIAAQ